MQLLRTSTFLRWVLFADAATCIATGLLMMLGSGLLERFLGLPGRASELRRHQPASLRGVPCLSRDAGESLAAGGLDDDCFKRAVDGCQPSASDDRMGRPRLNWVIPSSSLRHWEWGVFASLEYFGLRRLATAKVVTA